MPKSARVRDYMTASLVTLTPDMEMMRAVNLLVSHKLSGAPVIDNHGNLIGMLSERDCMKAALSAAYHEELAGRVSEFMSHGPKTIDADATLFEVAERFLNEPYRRYPVMDDNRLVGQISRSDVLRAIEALW